MSDGIPDPFIPPVTGDLADLEGGDSVLITGAEPERLPIQDRGTCTDIDASLRFAQAHEKSVRHVCGLGWHVWDGRRWAQDRDGRVTELAKETARNWTLQCCQSDDGERDRRTKSAMAAENASRVHAAVELARSDPRLVLPIACLDKDPWLLNVENGTIDLRTGGLRPHSRVDMITKLAPVHFDREARHPMFDRYVADIEANSKDMPGFLSRCFGAGITGDASTESLFLLQGDGGSGKTTLVEAVAAMLGDYAVKLSFESLCSSKHGRSSGAASPDLIPLRGSRLAYASEGEQNDRLDAGRVKMLTGNEPVPARALYQPPIIFSQTWKLWLVTNFDPRADSEDSGMWRRLLKLHFLEIPKEKRDPAIKSALVLDKATRSALLAFCVRGCLDWQKRGGGRIGLAPPAEVESATADYKLKQDTMASWWDDLLCSATLNVSAFTATRELRRHYQDWCDGNGARPVYNNRFAAYLEGKNLRSDRNGGNRGWFGIQLNDQQYPTNG